MNKFVLLFLSILIINYQAFAGNNNLKSTPESKFEAKKITEEEFNDCKKQLPKDLSAFVSDYQEWSKKERDKIRIIGHWIFESAEFDQELTKKYNNHPGHWIDDRTPFLPERMNLITCLEYLKQK